MKLRPKTERKISGIVFKLEDTVVSMAVPGGRPCVSTCRIGFSTFVEEVREKFPELPLALVSHSFSRGGAFEIMVGCGLHELIDIQCCLFWEKDALPCLGSEVISKAAHLLKIPTNEMIYFGDVAEDMATAANAGAIPVAMPRNWDSESTALLVKSGAEHIFRSWKTIDPLGLLDEIRAPEHSLMQ